MLPPGSCRECKEVHASARCWVQKVGVSSQPWERGILWWSLSRELVAGWGKPGAVLPGSTVPVPGPCSAHLEAAASPVLECHLSCMGESPLWGLEPPAWLVTGGTLLLMPSTLLFVVRCSR